MSTRNEINHQPKRGAGRLAVALAAIAMLGGTASALAADVPLLDREGQLEKSLEADQTRQEYHRLYDEAERLEVEPQRNVAAGSARAHEIGVGYATLTATVAKAKAKEKIERETKPEKPAIATPESVGVDQSTLDAIAACESGGDPTIVDASGTYHGKYQFDVGTWASVGGSGVPSAAPEEEQDYRAALLYSQAGSSPWPVCG